MRKVDAPHVAREQWTVRFAPTVAPDLSRLSDGVVKIVGVSDDLPAVEACERDLRERFGDRVSAARSQPYYVDVTHPNANKGDVVQLPVAEARRSRSRRSPRSETCPTTS